MNLKYFLGICLLFFLAACTGHEGDSIKTDNVKNSKLLIPPCLK